MQFFACGEVRLRSFRCSLQILTASRILSCSPLLTWRHVVLRLVIGQLVERQERECARAAAELRRLPGLVHRAIEKCVETPAERPGSINKTEIRERVLANFQVLIQESKKKGCCPVSTRFDVHYLLCLQCILPARARTRAHTRTSLPVTKLHHPPRP